jgi:hypothetical protein
MLTTDASASLARSGGTAGAVAPVEGYAWGVRVWHVVGVMLPLAAMLAVAAWQVGASQAGPWDAAAGLALGTLVAGMFAGLQPRVLA